MNGWYQEENYRALLPARVTIKLITEERVALYQIVLPPWGEHPYVGGTFCGILLSTRGGGDIVGHEEVLLQQL